MIARLTFFILLCAFSAKAETFAEWADSYGLTGDDAAYDADPDFDRIPNLLEYAFAGLDPTVINSAPSTLPQQGWLRQTGENRGDWEWVDIDQRSYGLSGVWHSGLRWQVRPGIEGVRFVPQLADQDSLTHWFDGRSAWIIQSVPGNVLQAVAITQGNRNERFFMRVKVVVDPNAGDSFSGIPVAGTAGAALTVSDAEPQYRAVSAGATSTVTDNDLTVLRSTSATRVSDFLWHYSANGEDGTVNRTSSDPAILSPNASDPFLWDYHSPGDATLQMRTATSTYTTVVTATTIPGQTVDEITGVVSGSLRAHLNAQIDGRIAGKTVATDQRIFTTQNHSTGTYVRNTSCWAAGVDLTPLSPWNSESAHHKAGTLISPCHVLFATHYHPATGTTIRFITSGNVVVTRTIISQSSLTVTSGYFPDLTVARLDSDVPGTIGFARVLPDNYTDYLPSLTQLEVPIFAADQEEKALIKETALPSPLSIMRTPAGLTRRAWDEILVSGDSGNPGCLIVNGQLVLVTVWTSGGGGTGTFINPQRAAINAIMTSLGGGHNALTDVDLSSFPTY